MVIGEEQLHGICLVWTLSSTLNGGEEGVEEKRAKGIKMRLKNNSAQEFKKMVDVLSGGFSVGSSVGSCAVRRS